MTRSQHHAPAPTSVEGIVREKLAETFGGVRGMLEAAIPTVVFTVVFVLTRDLPPALVGSVAVALVLVVVRVAQRSTLKFVANAFMGIALGALFAWMAARRGGDADAQALAYFVPGLLYNAVYGAVMLLSILARWPVFGFLVGSVTGEPTAWHDDRGMVRLCSRLTWFLVLPCAVRLVVQVPLYVAGSNGLMDPGTAIGLLGTAKVVMGWPLQVLCLGAMVWLLAQDRTPVAQEPATG